MTGKEKRDGKVDVFLPATRLDNGEEKKLVTDGRISVCFVQSIHTRKNQVQSKNYFDR